MSALLSRRDDELSRYLTVFTKFYSGSKLLLAGGDLSPLLLFITISMINNYGLFMNSESSYE